MTTEIGATNSVIAYIRKSCCEEGILFFIGLTLCICDAMIVIRAINMS